MTVKREEPRGTKGGNGYMTGWGRHDENKRVAPRDGAPHGDRG